MNLLDQTQTALVTAQPTPPAAGTDFQWDSPEHTRILIISIRLTLTTDTNTDSRRVTIESKQGSISFAQAPAPGDQTESAAVDYYFSPCVLGIDGTTDHSRQWAPVSPHFYLHPRDTLCSNISNLQSGDQVSDIRIRYYQKLPR